MLPIEQHRQAILDSIRANQVTIVVGETGSGKTTGIPQMLYESGFGQQGSIGITEPRRIAAISVAKYVAGNLDVELGGVVAHKIRFDDTTSPKTVVKFMSDGILLREFHYDPLLSKYAVIMVDEAHERSANIDFLLGLLKQVLVQRPELRIVISSATIDAEKFSRYFGGAPVITVDGRTFGVRIVWGTDASIWNDRTELVKGAVIDILDSSKEGDILVFLTGVDEIDAVSDALEELQRKRGLVLLPAHGGLSPEEQGKIFKTYPGKRKVVLATNIAETSITIDGIVYVIDPGYIKQTHFDPMVGIQSLDVVQHSQAGCAQRSGRAGRTREGVCYRLYSNADYNRRPAFTEPEIRRMSLASVVLSMEALEIPDIKNFDFIDPPDAHAFLEAYETLEALGAIEKDRPGLTSLGKKMVALPLEPRISRMVIEAEKHGCVEEIVTIAAFLSVRSVFARPKEKQWEADAAHMRFKNPRSDALTFLTVWRQYEASGFSSDWCFTHFLMAKTLKEIRNVRRQLTEQLQRAKVVITRSENEDAILRCVAAGLAYNLLRLAIGFEYEGVERKLNGIFIHPGSSIFGGANPQWMVASEIVRTTKRFARVCSMVKTEWLFDIAPTKFSLGDVVVRDYIPGSDHVKAARLVRFKDAYGREREVGEASLNISVDEASKHQQRNVDKAREAGWIELTVQKDSSSVFSYTKLGHGIGGTYRLSSAINTPIDGCKYYCEVQRSHLSSMPGFAVPKFRVFDLPPPVKPDGGGDVADAFAGLALRRTERDGSLGAMLADAVLRRSEATGK